MLAALDIHIPYHGKLLLGTSFLLRMSVSLSVSLYFGQSLSPGLSLLAPSLRKMLKLHTLSSSHWVPSSIFLPRYWAASRWACEPLQTCRSLLLLWEQSNLRRLVSLNIPPSIAVKYIDSKIHHFIWSIFRAYWVTCVFLLFPNAVHSSCGALLFGRPQSRPPRSQGKKPSYVNQCEQCRKNVVQSWQKSKS